MKKRLLTGMAILAIFVPLVAVKELFPLFQLLMMGLAALASVEMINLFEHRHKFPKFVKVLIVIFTIILYMSFISEYATQSLAAQGLEILNIRVGFIPTLLIIVIILLAMMVAYKDFNGASIGRALTTILYTSLGFGTITLLRAMGIEYILYLFIITMLTDTFAYLFGMAFGKHKMSPNISPKKSWEGAIGGTATAVAIACVFAFIYNPVFSSTYSNNFCIFQNNAYMDFNKLGRAAQIILVIFISITASIMGQIGDLVASKFKRTYEIKDFSDIFPGHGGVLDRFDSAIYAGMYIWAFIQIFNNIVNI